MKDIPKHQKQEVSHLFLCEEYDRLIIRFSQFMVDQVEVPTGNVPMSELLVTQLIFCEEAFYSIFYRNLNEIDLRDDFYLNKDQKESLSSFLEKNVKEIKAFWNGYKFAIQSNAYIYSALEFDEFSAADRKPFRSFKIEHNIK